MAVGGTSVTFAQPGLDETPLEARMKEFARVVSTGSRADIEQMVLESFGPQMQAIPMADHMNVLMSYHDMTRGLDFYQLNSSLPNAGIALFKNRLTGGWTSIFLGVEPEAPHRILGFQTADELHDTLPPDWRPPTLPPTELSERQIARELEAFMARLAHADVFSGAVALAKDGRIVFARAYGEADKTFGITNRTDTRFNLGSMNKMFTAVAIAQLVERGHLSYDDPLSKFLPEFPDPEAAKEILIKHLLSHTSGMGMWWTARYLETEKNAFRTVDDMMKWAANDENRQFEPGTRYQYSNTAFVVLGKVIEQVTGMTYYDYVRENIYEPAGMQHTESYELDRVNPPLATGYEKLFDAEGNPWFRSNVYVNPVRGGPHGGGYSTVEDLVKFDRALRSGRLLKPESVRTLQTAKPELNATRYGYGFDVNDDLGIAGHSGGGAGNSNNMDMFLRSGWTAVVLANYTETSLQVLAPVANKMRELLAGQTN
jgi:CubicO group peptidase (beta-lactamase class C family)